MLKQIWVVVGLIIFIIVGCKSRQLKKDALLGDIERKTQSSDAKNQTPKSYIINKRGDKIEVITHSEEEWEKKLTKEQFNVMREKGTERAFSSDMWENKKEGLYLCGACEQVLFLSNSKYDSGTGWPSFFRAEDDLLIKKSTDYKLGYPRTEVSCARCGSHLGHLFEDGPPPTGLRYCINAVSLRFIEANH